MLLTIFTAGLSTAEVSGIVIAVIVFIILVCLAVYVLCFKTHGKPTPLCSTFFVVKTCFNYNDLFR